MEFDENTTATQIPSAHKERRSGAKVYFCSECQSVLTPRVRKGDDSGKLEYFCQQCNRSEENDDFLVYVNILKRDDAGVSGEKDLTSDITLHRQRLLCNNCNTTCDHVIFNQPTLAGEETMRQLKQCCHCRYQSAMTYD